MTKLCPVLGKFMREVDVKVCEQIDLSHGKRHFSRTLIILFYLHML